VSVFDEELVKKLQESEQKYRELYENAPNAYFSIDLNKNITMYNYAALDLLGYSGEELLNKKEFDLYANTPEGLPKAQELYRKLLKGAIIKDEELQMKHKSGKPVWISLTVNSVKDKKGNITESRSMVIDITKRKLAELKLLESEENYKSLIEGLTRTGIGIDIVSNSYDVLYQNQVLLNRFGEIIGTKCFKSYLGENDPCQSCPMIKALKSKEVERLELEGKDGRYYEIISAPLYNPDGSIDKAIEVIIDMTDRKKAKAALLKEKIFTESALNAQRDTFFVFDPSNRTAVRWNKAFKDVSGYSDEEIASLQAPNSYFDEKDIKRAAEATLNIETSDKTIFEMNLITKKGNLIQFEYVGSSIKDEQGNLKYIVSVGRDITERKKAETDLKESEEKYRYFFNKAQVGLFWSRIIDGKFLECNDTFAKLVGYNSREECLADYVAIEHYVNLKDLNEMLEKINMNGDVKNFEIQVSKRDGTPFWANISARINLKENRIEGAVTDTTERKKTEQKLKESEEKYRSLFENSPIALMDQDFSEMKKYIDYLKASGINDFEKYFDDNPEELLKTVVKPIIVDVNKKTLEVYKLKSKEDIILKANQMRENLTNTMTEEAFLYNKMQLLSLINGETSYDSEIETTTFEGDIIHLYAKTSIVSGFENTWSKVILSIVNITERKKAEQKLKKSEERYRSLIEDAQEGVWALDENENTIFVNPRICEMLGYTKNEMMGKNLHLLIPDSMKERIKGNRIKREKGIKSTYELELLKKDGTIIYTNIKAAPIMSESRDYKGSFAYITDITEKKEIEDMKTYLLTRFSHEFKTPLISIKGFSDLLLSEYRNKLDEKTISFLEKIKEGGDKLVSLVNSFIRSSQLGEKLTRLKIDKVNLSDLIKLGVSEMQGLIHLRKHAINLDIPDKLIGKFDKEQIYSVITNLLLNAIKYTSPEGKISIHSKIEEGDILFSIKDNGIGLTEEDKRHLFKPFGKTDKYGKGWDIVSSGMGVGLYLSKGIISLHGGKIWAESEGKNKGSTFSFSLPMTNF